jgi:hypothetical protein
MTLVMDGSLATLEITNLLSLTQSILVSVTLELENQGSIVYNVEHIRRQGLELLNFQLRTDDK